MIEYGADMKICAKCKNEKDLAEFTNNKSRKDGKCPYCRTCYSEINKKWREDNPQKSKEITAKYRDNNKDARNRTCLNYYYSKHEERKEKQKLYSRSYRESNREKVRESNRVYAKSRRRSDLNYYLRCILRSRIRKALSNIKKSDSTIKLIGCTITELKEYLAKQFTNGMNWENYGQWHIDHIRPCASFNLAEESEQKACFHYTNLQPLWAADNIKKSDKY